MAISTHVPISHAHLNTCAHIRRDGYCRTDMMDHGRHVVCARVTTQFLEFSRDRVRSLVAWRGVVWQCARSW